MKYKLLLKQRIYTPVILIGLSVLLVCGCSELPPKTCAYCGGKIYWAEVGETWRGTRYQLSCTTIEGKDYHEQCIKIQKLEEQIRELQKQVER